MKKLLVSLMLIVASVSNSQNVVTLDPTQAYTTGNIVNSGTSPTDSTGTWQNIGLWNQGLPCWGPGGPVYCGPLPYYNQGIFNFSYGTADVYQVANIAKALPNSGTGLKVDGYNFGFSAKNGNGWDDGRTDYLYAYVHFTDKNNGVVYYKSYDLNYKFDWTTFNFNETFKTPYASKDLNNVTYGFVGRDNNFWAGPYGPEIYNVSFSLKYSVDQCAVNVLSSPTCPGYSEALAKIIPQPTSSIANDTTINSTSPTNTVTTTINDSPTNPTVTVTSTPTTSVGQQSTNTNNSVQTTVTTQQRTNQTTSGTSIGLSVISRNQQREQNIVSGAVQNAISSAESSATQSQQEAMSIASIAVSNSTTISASMSTQSQNGTGIRIQAGSSQVGLSSNMSGSFGVAENIVSNYSNMLTDKTNPLNEYIEHKPNLSNNQPITNNTVNRNAGNNEVAGGVDINRMALAPTGYNDYLNLTLRDASFYAPKEVYKNQKNVDNARVLRQLTNDSKHRDMVEQQYRR